MGKVNFLIRHCFDRSPNFEYSNVVNPGCSPEFFWPLPEFSALGLAAIDDLIQDGVLFRGWAIHG